MEKMQPQKLDIDKIFIKQEINKAAWNNATHLRKWNT